MEIEEEKEDTTFADNQFVALVLPADILIHASLMGQAKKAEKPVSTATTDAFLPANGVHGQSQIGNDIAAARHPPDSTSYDNSGN